MEFEINNCKWKIELVSLENLNNMYKSTHDGEFGKELYTFGLCHFISRTIFLNKELCYDELLRSLRHELTHAYLWSIGMQENQFDEEDICNIVSSISYLINSIEDSYKYYYDSKVKIITSSEMIDNGYQKFNNYKEIIGIAEE